MPFRKLQIVVDSADPERIGTFWAAALGYVEEPVPEGYDSWEVWDAEHGYEPNSGWAIRDPEGIYPELFFQRVPEPKRAKNRLHLDIAVSDIDAEVGRLVGLGATRIEEVQGPSGNRWVVLQDPEGNEFCVVRGE